MGSKVSINPVTTDYRSSQQLSTDLGTLADSFDNTFSLDGTAPNSLSAPLDMNGQRILNLPTPVYPTDAVRLQDTTTVLSGPPGPPADNTAIENTVMTNVVNAVGVITSIAAVTPANSNLPKYPTHSIYVATAGNLVVTMADSTTATYVMRAGGRRFIAANQINSSTSCTGIVAEYIS